MKVSLTFSSSDLGKQAVFMICLVASTYVILTKVHQKDHNSPGHESVVVAEV
jgi:hypothetical protein